MLKKSIIVVILLVLTLATLPVQGQDASPTEIYQSGYFHLRFDYPTGWLVHERPEEVMLLNYEYNNSGPNAPGEAWMQFLTAKSLIRSGFPIQTGDPTTFLDGLRSIFNQGNSTQGEATAITLGDRPAARADGTSRGNQTMYLAVSSGAGDMLLITGAAASDFATFESLFLQVAATAQYLPPQFADPLPPITPDNAAQVASYMEFNNSTLRHGQTEQVIFSPDGTRVANAVGFNGVQIWDTTSGTLLNNLENVPAFQVAFSPDNSHLVAIDRLDGLQIAALDSTQTSAVTSEHGLLAVAYSPDGSQIATGDNKGTIRVRSTETGEALRTVAQLDGVAIDTLSFSPDTTQLAATGNPGQVTLLRISSEVQRSDLVFGDATAGTVAGLAFSQDGSRLAVLATHGRYAVFAVASGETILAGDLAYSVLYPAIALNHDGSLLAVTTPADGKIVLIDVATGTTLALLSQGGDAVSSVAFSPDSTRLLAGGFYQDTLDIWAASHL